MEGLEYVTVNDFSGFTEPSKLNQKYIELDVGICTLEFNNSTLFGMN